MASWYESRILNEVYSVLKKALDMRAFFMYDLRLLLLSSKLRVNITCSFYTADIEHA